MGDTVTLPDKGQPQVSSGKATLEENPERLAIALTSKPSPAQALSSPVLSLLVV